MVLYQCSLRVLGFRKGMARTSDVLLPLKPTAPLAELKHLARLANLESNWQKIGSGHRKLLVDALNARGKEWQAFINSVPPFDATLAAARKALTSDKSKVCVGLRSKDDRSAACEGLDRCLETILSASVHCVPSGSGVHIGEGLVLTCAHCIDHDDDDEEEEDDGDHDHEPQSTDFTGGSSRPPTRAERILLDEATAAWRTRRAARLAASDGPCVQRVGRSKLLVTARGVVVNGTCVAADEGSDLALVRLDEPLPAQLGSLALAAEGADADGTAVVAIGNPYDWDLEAADGAKPRPMGYTPFFASAGQLEGHLSEEEAALKGVGAAMHSCWTYWGHSGCPIVERRGGIVALHSSWDDGNGQRHGVPLAAMRAFVAREVVKAKPAADSDDDVPLLSLADRVQARMLAAKAASAAKPVNSSAAAKPARRKRVIHDVDHG